ncbi:MAG: peptidyl-prolyl cis-trans isomerase D [Rhodobacteraceae bacterium HLUCCA08]|nr:MAG: peptidyl-prolyl cis-trans isomerase D [Rhodobacteraceae bacterium HLUCCA08]
MAKSKTSSTFVWIAAGVLVVGAFGFGATGLSGNIRSIGTVGALEVSANHYAFQLQQELRAQSVDAGRAVSFPDALQAGLPDRVLARLVTARVFDNEAHGLGLSVGDTEVREMIVNDPAFIGPSGFDRQVYAEQLARAGLNEADYEASLRDDSARTLLQAAIASGMPEPAVLADELALYIGQLRDITWASLDETMLDAPVPDPSDDDLRAFHTDNPDLFTTPETRAVTYAWLSPDMLADQSGIGDEDLREVYEERIDDYVLPERRLVERLVFSDEAAARAALDAIAAGETDFDTLVAERGLTLDDVDIGDVSEDALGEAGPAVFAAEPGEVTGPAPSEFGPALFRMNAILSAQETTFEEVRDDLFDEVASIAASRQIVEQAEPISNLLVGGARLEDLAEQTPMELGTIEVTADSIDGIAAYDAFRDRVAATDPGDYPELFELADGGLVALRVDALRAPELQEFETVRDAVAEAWAAEARLRAIRDRAAEIAARITPDTEFTDLGLDSAIAERDLTRRSFLADAPPGFMAEVFDMEPDEVRVLETETGAVILRLDTIRAADPEDTSVAAERDSIASTAGGGMAQDMLQLYADAIQRRTEIRIDDAAVQAVHNSFR